MRASRRNLQAQPNIKKKFVGTLNQPIRKMFAKNTFKVLNKSMFSTSRVKRREKFVWGLPDGVCRLNAKTNNKTKNFPKKVCLVP
jgi:hypothetical protein